MSEDFYLYYFKNWKDFAPLSELRATETFDKEGVCLKNKIGNIEPFKKDYPLMLKKR